jgi:hypothetical protein
MKPSFWRAHSPLVMLLTSAIVWMFFDCAGQPCDVTGPSGSDGICCGLWVFNLIFWVPAGLILLWLQKKNSFYTAFDRFLRALFYVLSMVILAWSFTLLKDATGVTKSNCYPIILISLIPNYLPAMLIYFVGRLSK